MRSPFFRCCLLLGVLGNARGEDAFVRSAIAGGAAAAAATIALHPVDTVKTLLQQNSGSAAAARTRIGTLGARGLYRGVLPAAFSMMPACAVRMGSYESFKDLFLLKRDQGVLPERIPPAMLVGVASALSVVVSASVRSPLDLIKTQVQTGAATSAVIAMRAACEGGGMRAAANFYRGAGLTLLRDVPFFTINLVLYEQLKAAALARADATSGEPGSRRTELDGREALLLGAIAQGVAGFSTNPIDALKTRVQAGGAAGMRDALRALLASDGPAGLMRGAAMRTVWIMPQGVWAFAPAQRSQGRSSPQ